MAHRALNATPEPQDMTSLLSVLPHHEPGQSFVTVYSGLPSLKIKGKHDNHLLPSPEVSLLSVLPHHEPGQSFVTVYSGLPSLKIKGKHDNHLTPQP